MSVSTGQRGKTAESLLQKALAKIEASRHNFCFERIYDARSSMGKMSNPRVGDFVLYYPGVNIIIECKEVAHDYRLSYGNFDLAQRARMYKRQLAGTTCVVLVYHSTTSMWRMQGLDYFRNSDKEAASWDMRDTPECSLDVLIKELIC